jgi:phage terminase large subunit
VPHDANVREAGAPGARTRIETLGRKPEVVPNEGLMEGINAGRKTIPFARFDAKRCAQGLEALRSYRTEWVEKARAFKRTPADAWRYLSLSWRAPEPEKVPIGLPLPDMTMDQFLEMEDQSDRYERV